MSIVENKALATEFIDEVWNRGNISAIEDFCIAGSMFANGLEGQIRSIRTAFPDFRIVINEIIAEGNKVVLRVTTEGTNSGPMVGFPSFGRLEKPVPPTGKSMSATGTYIFTISSGKIISYAAEIDQIGTLRQIGWTFTPPSPP